MRTETDFLGQKEIPDDALYGIHSVRATENFPDRSPFHIEWYTSIGWVKQACYLTYKDFLFQIDEKLPDKKKHIKIIDYPILESMIDIAGEVSSGKYFNHFIVPAISGGAGTSINMNVNEIIANASLLKLNKIPGDYTFIDPTDQANIFQSTNDVIPTSLKLTAIRLLLDLEENTNMLRAGFEHLEKKYRNTLRSGFTQMQQAVPSSYGALFSTYSEALSRDWWRVSKCFERIKVVNLGGGAIGSGLTIPRYFIMNVVQKLNEITGLPIARSENMHDATNNVDALVEVHAILKSMAVNFEKIVSDLRLLSSDVISDPEIKLPERQVGSSIMPGKINPVVPEYVISVAHKIYANDQIVTSLAAQGCLDLNAYIPVIGNALIESIKLLNGACITLKQNMVSGLIVHKDISIHRLLKSPVIATALIPFLGYHSAGLIAKEMQEHEIDIYQANEHLGLISDEKLNEVLKPENLLKEGFSLKEIGD